MIVFDVGTRQINVDRLNYELQQQFPNAVASWDEARGLVYVERAPYTGATQAIIDAHDPHQPGPYEQALALESALEATRSAAKAAAAGVPDWATFTEQEAIDYIDANVADLESAKAVMKRMARMVVNLRDAVWPDLG